ncbi:MAG: LptF/LptG family permease [Hyphomonadaceae bacterium]|nr:LptF/LptG family permease [Hyphomonadaceae bacterium]
MQVLPIKARTDQRAPFRFGPCQRRAYCGKNGGSPQRYWLQFHRKIALPVTLLAMAMIAAVLSLSTNRSGGRAVMVAAAIVSGLVIYFINDLSGALATTGFAPSWIAAWAPPLTALFVAMATVSFREDG